MQQAPAAGPERVRVEPVAAAKLQSEKGGQGPGEQPAGRRSQELPPRPPENVREPVQSAPTAEARCIVTDTDNVVIYVGEITYRGDVVRLNIELIKRRRG